MQFKRGTNYFDFNEEDLKKIILDEYGTLCEESPEEEVKNNKFMTLLAEFISQGGATSKYNESIS